MSGGAGFLPSTVVRDQWLHDRCYFQGLEKTEFDSGASRITGVIHNSRIAGFVGQIVEMISQQSWFCGLLKGSLAR